MHKPGKFSARRLPNRWAPRYWAECFANRRNIIQNYSQSLLILRKKTSYEKLTLVRLSVNSK
jgi:hypothetical protein